MTKLAIVTTHPIQYHSPLFEFLASRGKIEIKVFYTWSQIEFEEKYDPGFQKMIGWDIPLLEGYNYTFVKNIASNPGSHHFAGIVNPELISLIEKWNAKALLIFGWNFKSHLKCIRYFSQKIPVLFRGDSNLIDEKIGLKRILRRIFLSWVYSHIDYALYVGIANREYFKAHGVKDENLVFAPHAIDNHRFQIMNEELKKKINEERLKFGIEESDIVILFVGKFEKKKNPLLLINAFKVIDDSRLKLLFVGDGEMKSEMRDASVNDKRIKFLGFQNQSQMSLVYRMGNVFVLPSSGPGETWGLSVNEAMACGRPILVSDKCGCARDLVENGKNGFVFSSNNQTDLTNKIIEICKDKNLLKQMAVSSSSIIKNWNFEQVGNSIENIVMILR